MTSFYTGEVIDFMGLTSNEITFHFDGLPTHKKLLVRARVQTECDATKDKFIRMTLADVIVTNTLTAGMESIVEGKITHSAASFVMTIQFGTQG